MLTRILWKESITMRKKNTIFILCLLILTIMISGCSKQSESKRESEREARLYKDFREVFDERLEALPEYKATALSDVTLEGGELVHTIWIEFDPLDESYSVQVTCDKEDQIQRVFLSTDRKSYGNLQFAVFSLYLYDAMGLTEIKADDFYDKYDLFSEDDLFVTDVVEDWELTFMTTGDSIVFNIGIPIE